MDEENPRAWYEHWWLWTGGALLILFIVIPSNQRSGEETASVTEKTRESSIPSAPEESRPSFQQMLNRADSLEADSQFSKARSQLQAMMREYPDSLAAEDIQPRMEKLDSSIQAEREREAAERKARRLAAKWSYRTLTDDMTGGTIRRAIIRSENTISLEFPYQGAQHGTLTLRNHPSYGRDVIFSIERGQLLCRSYSGCQVRVRFDDRAPTRWSASGPSDNSTTALFIRNYSGFLGQLRRSEVVRIQPEIYREGAPVFEFRVGGFDFDRYSGQD